MDRGAAQPGWRWLAHPAHLLALGFGSGLAPRAPGTFGTLAAWLAWHAAVPADAVDRHPVAAIVAFAAAVVLGTLACTFTARRLGRADPGAIVWDEWLAFAVVLAFVMPAPWPWQLAAFALFRAFDAAKPGPIGWVDRSFKPRGDARIGWWQGFGILADDLAAALATLLVLAALVRLLPTAGG